MKAFFWAIVLLLGFSSQHTLAKTLTSDYIGALKWAWQTFFLDQSIDTDETNTFLLKCCI